MDTVITHTGHVEIHHDGVLLDTLDPLDARGYALMILEAADAALTQDARNFAFQANQRNQS